jgi:GPH family glycoside/pentoside/hexuronide:cation symporter
MVVGRSSNGQHIYIRSSNIRTNMTRHAIDPSQPQTLTWRLRIGWGIGSLGSTTLINGVTFLALFYFTQILGLPPALAGALLFVAKLYDIVTDPLMGLISDRCNTRWGRRRPFLLAASVVSAASFIMLFHVPDTTETGVAIYVGLALVLYATGYTLFNIPYLAMPAEMTSDYHERSRLMSARVVFASLGILAGGALAPALVTFYGDGPEGYASMSKVLAVVIGVSMVACFFGTRSAAFTRHVATPMRLREQWVLAAGNRPFVVLIISKFLHMTGVAVINSSLLYLIILVLQRETVAAGAFGVAATTATIVSMPAWLALSRRWGKRNTYMVGVALYVPVLLSWLPATAGEPFAFLILRGLGIGLVTGGLTLTAQAMLPDTIDFDTQRSGLRREATFTSVYSFMEKCAFALGPLLVGALLATAGYDPGTTSDPGTDVIRMVLIAAAVIPATASTLSALVLRFYTLDSRLRPPAEATTPTQKRL